MRDATIVRHLSDLKQLPTVAEIVTQFKCGWQQATRCRDAVREAEQPQPLQQPGQPR